MDGHLKFLIFTSLLFLLAALVGPACSLVPVVPTPQPPPVDHRPGQVVEAKDTFGTFYAYVPEELGAAPGILVLVHGTPAEEETAEATARYYVENWADFAGEQGFILIAPAFNQEDFSSRKGDHALGGYRGLFGREIGADEWLLRLVQAHRQVFGVQEESFYMYGHSAGGQFAARFLVTHPEQVRKAVITAAATYPQPNPEVAWPFGMAELHADIEWDAGTINRVDVAPDKQKWLAATQVPLTVIVGLNDTAELPAFPGQKGKNRFGIGRKWVQDMASFAGENGLECRFEFEMVPGTGHSMSGLLPYSQKALLAE